MTAPTLFMIGAFAVLAWGCYWKMRFHSAKAEVYQEFADTYSQMNAEGLFRKPKDQRRAESCRHHMRLVLCDPLIRDGLWDALREADEHWGRMSSDPPREAG